MEPNTADLWEQTRQRALLTFLMVSKLSRILLNSLCTPLFAFPSKPWKLPRICCLASGKGCVREEINGQDFSPFGCLLWKNPIIRRVTRKEPAVTFRYVHLKHTPSTPCTCIAFASHTSTRIISFHKHLETRQRNRFLSGFISFPSLFPQYFTVTSQFFFSDRWVNYIGSGALKF